MKNTLLLVGMLLGLLMACSKSESTPTPEPVKSSEKQLTGFRFTGIDNNGVTSDIPGVIDEQAKAIAVALPSGTDITALEPELEIPDKAVYKPTGPQDFSTPINFTITAEDGTSSTYQVTVAVALSQKEILLLISAANSENDLDWKETDDLSDWEEVTLDGNGNITALDLSNRNLSIIPPEIGQLGDLERLDLSHNILLNLPPEIGQLESLITLILDESFLLSLPPEIGQLTSLEELYITDCPELQSLPPEIGQLVSLKNLDLSDNDLSSLPAEIGQLNSLERLKLRSNNLSSLPSEIKQLVNLKELDLVVNNLSEFNHMPFITSGGITFGCSTETNLEILRLSGNPALEALDQCICDLDLDNGGTVDIDVVFPGGIPCIGTVVTGK